jgi:hypothetical protein
MKAVQLARLIYPSETPRADLKATLTLSMQGGTLTQGKRSFTGVIYRRMRPLGPVANHMENFRACHSRSPAIAQAATSSVLPDSG